MSKHSPEQPQATDPASAAAFLDRDFNQCFAQMRHYDDQLWDVTKFAFTGYAAVLALSIGLFEYSRDKSVDLIPPAFSLLLLALLMGLFLFALTIRNRVYFVIVTRYVNEHRAFFLRAKPLGFSNSTHMYTNPNQPPYFNWRSSQAWLSLIVAALNGSLAAGAAAMALRESSHAWTLTVGAFALVLLFQVAVGISYLKRREHKGASKAVFGTE